MLLAVLAFSGCSLTGDDDSWPPTVEKVQAELGTPPRGTMRIKDYDQNDKYNVNAVYAVHKIDEICNITIRWRYEDNTEFKYNASFGFYSSQICDVESLLAMYSDPRLSLYPLVKYYDGSFRALNDSTITGAFVLKAQANGFIPATRRLAGTFTARRVACLPNSYTGVEGPCDP